jgi:hypothetical protein
MPATRLNKARMAMDRTTYLRSRGEVDPPWLVRSAANDAAPAVDPMTFFNGRNYPEGKRLYDQHLASRNR